LLGTQIFKKLIEKFEEYINNESNIKAHLIFAHEFNILSTLLFQNLSSWECQLELYKDKNAKQDKFCYNKNVLFSSQAIFELYKKDNTFYIKFMLNGEYLPICENGKKYAYK